MNIKHIENQLKEIISFHLPKGRDGDLEHVTRAVNYGRMLLEHEPGDEDIVIPALYLHDIGWTRFDFRDFSHASPAHAEHTTSEIRHMHEGAIFAKKILENLRYDPQKIQSIASIIAIHDLPEKVFALDDASATLIVEADRLDRYGVESFLRFEKMFGTDYLKGEAGKDWLNYLRNGLTLWFKTRTGKKMAGELAREIKLLP